MTAKEFKTHIVPAYGAMLALARRMLAEAHDDPDDVVQDVFRSLWEKHSEMVLPDNPTAFVLRCIRNRCLDLVRKPVHTVPIEYADIDNTSDDDEAEIFEERLTLISHLINNLGEPRRSILRLNIRGVPTERIALQFKLSEGNVRQILSRTRRELRTLAINSINSD